MQKEIILLKDVEGLGPAGTVVKVSSGYARNYLEPQGLGMKVTPAARRRLESQQRMEEQRQADEIGSLRALAERLAETSCTIPMKAGPDGKLFGSVSSTDILEQLKLQGVEIERRSLMMEEPLHETGVFKIGVRLHPEVETVLKVWVVEDNG